MWVRVEGYNFKLIIADCFVTCAIITAVLWNVTDIHNAFCFLIGVVSAFLLGILFHTSVGFWIVSTVFSVFWSLIPISITSAITDADRIWVGVVGLISFIVCMIIHISEKDT